MKKYTSKGTNNLPPQSVTPWSAAPCLLTATTSRPNPESGSSPAGYLSALIHRLPTPAIKPSCPTCSSPTASPSRSTPCPCPVSPSASPSSGSKRSTHPHGPAPPLRENSSRCCSSTTVFPHSATRTHRRSIHALGTPTWRTKSSRTWTTRCSRASCKGKCA